MKHRPAGLVTSLIVHLLLLSDYVGAFRLDVQGRRKPPVTRLHPRANIAALTNSGDISYHVNLTLGGREFDVLVDTGRYVATKYSSWDQVLICGLVKAQTYG